MTEDPGPLRQPLLGGRAAFVTGAGSGIGRAIAERFAAEGAAVALADLSLEGVTTVAGRIRAAGGVALALRLDVTDEADMEAAVARAESELGPLSIGVANAGIWLDSPLVGHTLRDWERVLAVNLDGVFLTLRALTARMLARGGPGRLVAISSVAGRHGARGRSAYAASKFGVLGLVQSLAREVGPAGITVNAICPGDIDTPMQDTLAEVFARRDGVSVAEARARLAAGPALGRLGTPDEVAKVAVFLASDLSSYVSGSHVVVDGGALYW